MVPGSIIRAQKIYNCYFTISFSTDSSKNQSMVDLDMRICFPFCEMGIMINKTKELLKDYMF